MPGFALRWIARQSLGKFNVACTNVPGASGATWPVRIEACIRSPASSKGRHW
jgi:hypothetical protein